MKNYKFTISGHKYEVDILDVDSSIAKIEVNGTPYLVEIHSDLKQAKTPTLVRSVMRDPQKKIEKKDAGAKISVKAPLPGIILELAVKEGDQVKKGQKLAVMEAMKMENEIKAEKDGEILSVKVSQGQSILQDDVIIEMS